MRDDLYATADKTFQDPADPALDVTSVIEIEIPHNIDLEDAPWKEKEESDADSCVMSDCANDGDRKCKSCKKLFCSAHTFGSSDNRLCDNCHYYKRNASKIT